MILVQPTVLVTVVTLTLTLAWQASTYFVALKLDPVDHPSFPTRRSSDLTAGAVVSITVMTCARLVLLPQPSLAVQVRVMISVQPTSLVPAHTHTVSLPWQASTNAGALKLGAVGHSIVPSGP